MWLSGSWGQNHFGSNRPWRVLFFIQKQYCEQEFDLAGGTFCLSILSFNLITQARGLPTLGCKCFWKFSRSSQIFSFLNAEWGRGPKRWSAMQTRGGRSTGGEKSFERHENGLGKVRVLEADRPTWVEFQTCPSPGSPERVIGFL